MKTGTNTQKPFLAINLKLNLREEANNQSAFARKHALTQTLISRCLRDGQQSHRGWVFKWTRT